MRISIVVSNSLKKDPRVIKQIKIAKKYGYEVQFVGYRDEYFDKEFLDELGIRYDIVWLDDKWFGHLPPHKAVYRMLLKPYKAMKYIEAFKPSVIHSNDFDTLILSYLAAKKCGARVCYDSHEVYAENGKIANNKSAKKIVKIIENHIVHRIGKMISVSNSAADYFKDLYKIERPTVITNCPMRNTLPLREKTEKFSIVFQGKICAGRGYEEFVKSAKYLDDDYEIVIRGYGPLEDYLRNLAKEEKVEDRVSFASPVEVAELVSAASESNVGIVLTRPVSLNFKLSVSNKIFEYAQAGLPVIMSAIPEHIYLNEKYNFGILVEEVTPKCIASAIRELHDNKEKYEELSKNAKKMAEELVWEKEAEKLIKIYEELGK